MPILSRVEDPHQVYADAFRHLLVDGQMPIVIVSRLRQFTSSYYLVRAILSVLSALLLVVDIYRAWPGRQKIFVREFWTIPLLVTAPLLIPFSGSVLFNINHNLTSNQNGLPWPIFILARLGFQFVLFDGAGSVEAFPESVKGAFKTPLFPCSSTPHHRQMDKKLCRIGIMGSIASIEEAGADLVNHLEQLGNDSGFTLCYGARGRIPQPLGALSQLEIIDSYSRAEFQAYLETLDFAIFVASARSFYHRHSGTVMDAVVSGVIPIVPAFPVLESQISNPAQVGRSFRDYEELVEIIQSARENPETLANNREGWSNARSHSRITLGHSHDESQT